MSEPKKILMVCLGNICRSPIAEAVFKNYVTKNNLQSQWEIDSAALIGYHTGKNPDHRATETILRHGITDYKHKARPVNAKDFERFDWIFGMDNENIRELNRMKPAESTVKVELLGNYDPQGEKIIRDPYYDSEPSGFEKAYVQCERCVEAFFEKHS